MSERKTIPYEVAVAMLPDGDTIHTFRNAGTVLIGADWDRSEILDALGRFNPELSGPMATSMNHSLAFRDDHGWVFVATKPEAQEVKHNPETHTAPAPETHISAKEFVAECERVIPQHVAPLIDAVVSIQEAKRKQEEKTTSE